MTTQTRLHTSPPAPSGSAEEPAKPKLDLSITQVLGGALAAMTAAFLGSRLSVAGTVVGAAVASIVAAVAGSVYTASLRSTQDRVKSVFRGRASSSPEVAGAETTVPETGGPDQRWRFPWKTVTVSALGAFVLAAVVLTGLEVAAGRSLSGEEGTTVTQVAEPQRAVPQNDPTPSASPSSASPSASVTPTPGTTSSTEPTPEPSTEAVPSVESTPAPAPLPSEALPSASNPAPAPSVTVETPVPSAGG